MVKRLIAVRMMLWAGISACLCPPLHAAGQAAHWTYAGDSGPRYWGKLAEEFRTCSEGRSQSPVDLGTSVSANLVELDFEYHASPLEVLNNGHSLQQTVGPDSFLAVGDNSYRLRQFHFHSPSEHRVDGRPYPMELHLVHEDDKGALAVVGVMISEGREHPVIGAIWSALPLEAGDSIRRSTAIDAASLLPPVDRFFRYSGSLTTPPCSEGVTWIVLAQAIEASPEQIGQFRARFGAATNRPVQPLNARLVLRRWTGGEGPE